MAAYRVRPPVHQRFKHKAERCQPPEGFVGGKPEAERCQPPEGFVGGKPEAEEAFNGKHARQ